jgi:hypothetical protein
MTYFKTTGLQISPCILSKAKYALNLKALTPKNKKKCSKKYWILAIESIANEKNISDESIINSAIEMYTELIVNYLEDN